MSVESKIHKILAKAWSRQDFWFHTASSTISFTASPSFRLRRNQVNQLSIGRQFSDQ